jgi:hypothetical protein
MSQSFDASRSLATVEKDKTIVAVIELSQAKLLVAALVPGVERQPLKKLGAEAASAQGRRQARGHPDGGSEPRYRTEQGARARPFGRRGSR